HIEVGMFYLEVKRFHYKLSQKYGTTTPFFMDALKKHHDKVGAKGKTARDVGSIKNLTSEILGKVRRCAIKWADADFVYIPLNTGKHWILLVLEIEGKTIWVYNSMRGKSTGLKDMAAYIACIKHLLPKLLDACGVYKQHPSGPMGNQEIRINEALNCPQQTDQGNYGMFVLKIAKYLMMDRKINQVCTEEMAAYRVKMATELYKYAESKKAV
ncbi:unnamed protein product, partial [Cuscuta campestris]